MDSRETLELQYQHLKREYEKAKINNYRPKVQRELKIRLKQLEDNIKFIDEKRTQKIPKIERNFSFLSYLDKKSLIDEIINTETPYRETLGIKEKVGFGIEIEVVNIFLENLRRLIKEKNETELKLCYEVEEEHTVCSSLYSYDKRYQGGEVVTPILQDNKETWEDLKKLFAILRENHLEISENCSMHIHVGSEILDYREEELKKVLRLFVIYEHVLFRFFLGDYFKVRNPIFTYPLRPILWEEMDKIEEISLNYLKNLKKKLSKFTALNIYNFDSSQSYKKNTIEMRLGNGTLNEEIMQNYVMTTIHFLKSVNNPGRLDFYLEDKWKKIKEKNYYYTDLALEDAFEF